MAGNYVAGLAGLVHGDGLGRGMMMGMLHEDTIAMIRWTGWEGKRR